MQCIAYVGVIYKTGYPLGASDHYMWWSVPTPGVGENFRARLRAVDDVAYSRDRLPHPSRKND